MIHIENKKQCCGCTACANACPTGCISMQPDEEGFLYPYINKEKCIECNKCDTVCPIKKKHTEAREIESICLRSVDIDTVNESTSGGFFTPLSKYVLEKNGVVVGVAFTESKKIEHIFVDSENSGEVSKLRGSKYVQSYLYDTFSRIKEILDNEKLVCFSGTPCQVSGLISYLGRDYKNLITVDVVCHGTPSPKLWKKYVEYQERKHNSRIREVSFRKKTYGYHSGTMELVFESGKKYNGSARVDYMLKSFFREISSRPSCYDCSFKTDQHQSDFTIFDCWSASKLVPGLKDDDRGYTNVFINSDKGRKLFEELRDDYEWYPVEKEQAIKLDGVMIRNSATPHTRRDEYYLELENEELDEHIQKFIPISKKDYFVENSKSILYKTKLLYTIKNIKKHLKG